MKLLWITKSFDEREKMVLIIGTYCLLNRSKHVYGKQFYFDITKSHVGEVNETILKHLLISRRIVMDK